MVSANEFFIGMLNLFLIARFARVLFQRLSALCVVQCNQLIIIGWLKIYDYKGGKKIVLSSP